MDFYEPLHKSVNTREEGGSMKNPTAKRMQNCGCGGTNPPPPEEFQSLKMILIEIVTTLGRKPEIARKRISAIPGDGIEDVEGVAYGADADSGLGGLLVHRRQRGRGQ